MKVFKNPNSDFHVLLWANQDEISGLSVAVYMKKVNVFVREEWSSAKKLRLIDL